MRPLRREGTAERFWEKQADSFVLIHPDQGEIRLLLFIFLRSDWKQGSHCVKMLRSHILSTQRRCSNLNFGHYQQGPLSDRCLLLAYSEFLGETALHG